VTVPVPLRNYTKWYDTGTVPGELPVVPAVPGVGVRRLSDGHFLAAGGTAAIRTTCPHTILVSANHPTKELKGTKACMVFWLDGIHFGR